MKGAATIGAISAFASTTLALTPITVKGNGVSYLAYPVVDSILIILFQLSSPGATASISEESTISLGAPRMQ